MRKCIAAGKGQDATQDRLTESVLWRADMPSPSAHGNLRLVRLESGGIPRGLFKRHVQGIPTDRYSVISIGLGQSISLKCKLCGVKTVYQRRVNARGCGE